MIHAYVYRSLGGDLCLLGVYVDDIALASRSTARLTEVKNGLGQEFDIKDIGKLQHFLGIKVLQDDSTGN